MHSKWFVCACTFTKTVQNEVVSVCAFVRERNDLARREGATRHCIWWKITANRVPLYSSGDQRRFCNRPVNTYQWVSCWFLQKAHSIHFFICKHHMCCCCGHTVLYLQPLSSQSSLESSRIVAQSRKSSFNPLFMCVVQCEFGSWSYRSLDRSEFMCVRCALCYYVFHMEWSMIVHCFASCIIERYISVCVFSNYTKKLWQIKTTTTTTPSTPPRTSLPRRNCFSHCLAVILCVLFYGK